MANKVATRGSWVKGKSGNPSGRPRQLRETQELVERLAGEHVEEVVAGLVALFRTSADERCRIEAGKILLERGAGRVRQQTELTGPNGGAIQFEGMTDEQLARLAADAAKMLAQ